MSVKLLLPVSVIVFAAGACCCCGSDMTSQLEELGVPADAIPSEGSSGSADAAPVAAGGASLAGTCGKFKEKGLTAPSGSSVMVCSEGGGNDSIVISGGGTPEEVCKSVKAWAEGAGYTTEFDTNAAGTWAVTMKGASDRLTIGCTEMAGSTTSSVSVTPL